MEEDKLADSPTASAMEQEMERPDPAKRKRRKLTWIIIMVIVLVILLALVVPLAVVYGRPHSQSIATPVVSETLVAPWSIANFKQLISFGDSYTDEGRAVSIGNPQPPGWVPPVVSFAVKNRPAC
jgi:hypothetical protein